MLRTRFAMTVMVLSLVVSWTLSGNLISAAADSAKAKPKAAAAKKGKKASEITMIRGYYAIVAKELELTDDQRIKLEVALKGRAEAKASWEQANGEKDGKLSDAIKAARKAKDKDKTKALSDQQKKLRAERDKPDEQFKSKFNALLTAKQRTHLAGYSLYMGTMQRLSKAKPTDEQKAKIKAMALEAGGDVPDGKDKKVEKAFREGFAEKAAQAVLSPEQREALSKKKPKPAK